MLVGSRILVVEDVAEMRQVVRDIFLLEQALVYEASNASETLQLITQFEMDLVILDLGLPDNDGLSLMKDLKQKSATPVLVLTGRGHVADLAVGFEVGADDYLTKPFNAVELVARSKAIIRRHRLAGSSGQQNSVKQGYGTWVFSGWKLDYEKGLLESPKGTEVTLTDLEFKYLCLFLDNPDQNISRDQLDRLSSTRKRSNSNRAIDAMIGKLRKKLGDDPANPSFIRTVRNRGFRFVARVDSHEE